MGQKN